MKKFIILPALGILSVALFSFKSASSSEGRIVRLDDGSVIIPSSCRVTPEDQNKILSIMSSYGDDAGFAVYTDESGKTRVYNPTPADVLMSVDEKYGTDLGSGTEAFRGWAIFKSKICRDILTEYIAWGSDLTVAMSAELNPILAKYE